MQVNGISSNKSKNGRLLLFILLGCVLVYVLVYLQTPYYILRPGTAEEIKPMVEIQNGFPEEQGTFMLTTIRMTYSNALTYMMALFNANAEILKVKDLLQEGETQEDYSQRQNYVMQTSQSNAIIAAYKKAGIDYKISNGGVMVLQTVEGMPAEEILKPGDLIVKIDDIEMHSRDDMMNYLQGQSVGKTLKITYKRENIVHTTHITLEALPVNDDQDDQMDSTPRAGLGILPVELLNVEAIDPSKQVVIHAGDIGGPSAGLMFALEIYNQLLQQDITKGYRIAGTGTINTEGQVGVIGGIQFKVIAADKEGADIFFAPADYYAEDESYSPVLNTTEAQAQAKKIHTKMKVVSVASLDDAVKYLENLPPKS